MDSKDFDFLKNLLLKESGLVVTPEKMYLLESRLLPLAAKKNLDGLVGLISNIRTTNDRSLTYEVVEAMTTNETSFFRDTSPFDRLRDDVMPFLIKNRPSKTLKIWSAACSSGQEPYSIAMILKEMPALTDWRIEIVATDLSREILDQAKKGIYSQFEVQRGLPIKLLVKYFTQNGDKWAVNDLLKKAITFREANLLRDIRGMESFDIVFCRNVLIYFDLASKTKILSDVKNVLKQDGVLFLGGAETVIGVSNDFKPVPELRGLYVRHDSSFSHK